MAYVNVAEWKTDQVCEWLKGLDNTVLPYVHSFMNHGVSGQQLLSLRPEDLEHLGVLKLGHQEIILEAVEYLRNFHYELDRENLQLLALRLSCQAHSLHNELSRQTDSKPVTTQTLSDVASVVMAVKPLVRWLDRPPFSGQLEYSDKKTELMKLSLEMATCAQRDRFAEKPIEEIRTTCGQLAKLADYIIQDIADPMILQPASLDLATLKKRPGDDLGFYILPSFHGAHQIAEIKFGSAAHQCGKMEEGDEIVQVNYQTVVGWERKNVLELFRESPAEVLLTLKRRPRHTKVYGQIYIKPYRLPSNKKTSYTTRWQHNLPSPRPELLTIPDFTMPLPRHIPKNPSPEPASILDTVNMLDTMATDSSDSDSEVEPPLSIRLYSAKPRNLVQRRATIPGASPTTKHGIDIEQFWKELKQEHRTTFQLRDKAASCAHGLDNVPSNLRPQTCLGIEQTKRKKRLDGQFEDRKVQFQEKSNEIESGQEPDDVRHKRSSQEEFIVDVKGGRSHSPQATVNVIGSNSSSDIIVPSNECNNSSSDRTNVNRNGSSKAHGARVTKERGKLDKSYSTPAYDLTDAEDKEDRKFLPLESSICKLDLPAYSSRSDECNANLSKTDTCPSSDVSEEQRKLSGARSKAKEVADFDIVDDLVQKVYAGDERARSNDSEEQECVFRVPEQLDLPRNTVYIKVSDVSYRSSIKENQSNTKGITQDANAFSKSCVADGKSTEIDRATKDTGADDPSDNCSLTQDSSEEKSESISSYIEGMYSSGSDGDTTLKKFGEILETIDSALTEHTKFIERKDAHRESYEAKEQRSDQDQASSVETAQGTRQNSKLEGDRRQQYNEIKSNSNSQTNVPQPCRYAELPKLECVRKVETKPHSTPPEPPPRKYFTKPTPLDFSSVNAGKLSENQEKPQVPERPSIRREYKKVEIINDSYVSNHVDHQGRNDAYDGYVHSVEKSIDFIDEPSTTGNEQRTVLSSDTYLYSENNDKSKEEKSFEKYEPFIEKFGPSSSGSQATDYYRSEHSRNIDYTDGLACSRQYQSPDSKSRACEKDKSFEKGVVNRAMMVARSIGLHGSLSKSSTSSPRTCRKRNTLLAKKRSVSVKDVGSGDLEGWLTYRSRGAGGAWAKAWFVLKCSSLYRFRTQDSLKADCLIALTGFTVSQAAEVKSRKYAFKVYHTGTVFYFAADTEDSLVLWLDAVNKATLGTDSQNRSSGLFSETDDSDAEYKSKAKSVHTPDSKQSVDKSFGSLKKVVRKDSGYKDHEIGGASLDRKYLKFLGARNQNLPVPTAQFRSYRKVLPMSASNKKQDSIPNSPDLQVTIAGSTFYGLSASQSATDMSTNSQDMGDYRRTSDRSLGPRNRRPDELHGFMTLEEFMLSQQDEEQRQVAVNNRPVSPRVTPLISDHVHIQHRNFNDSGIGNEQIRHGTEVPFNNGVVYGQTRSNDETLPGHASAHGVSRNVDSVQTSSRQPSRDLNANRSESRAENASEKACGKCKMLVHKKWEPCTHRKKTHDGPMPKVGNDGDFYARRSMPNEQTRSVSMCHNKPDVVQSQTRPGTVYEHNGYMYSHGMQHSNEAYRQHNYAASKEFGNLVEDLQSVPNRLTKNDGYSGSSGDLTSHASSETLQRAKKDALVSRKGSFNLTSRCREHFASDKHWLDSLRRNDKKSSSYEKNRLKNVAQYQPPPIPTSPFEQDGMKAAFEMHLDKNEQVQKANRLKSLFSTKCQQKPCTLELPKDTPKTLLGSPRLHRALFRDKNTNQSQQRLSTRSDSQSPGDSGISQSFSSYSGNSHSHTLSQSFSSASSVSDWSPDTLAPSVPSSSKCNGGHSSCQKGLSGRNSLTPPTLPYVPPPTSPPPDYPGLEYPPVFEPGTYSLSDASLLRNRSRNSQNNMH